MNYPKLIESSSKYYLGETLSQFHEKRKKINSLILNSIVLIMFVAIFGTTLYFNRRTKLSPYHKHMKNLKDQEFILRKIRNYQHKKEEQLLTTLPIVYNPL